MSGSSGQFAPGPGSLPDAREIFTALCIRTAARTIWSRCLQAFKQHHHATPKEPSSRNQWLESQGQVSSRRPCESRGSRRVRLSRF